MKNVITILACSALLSHCGMENTDKSGEDKKEPKKEVVQPVTEKAVVASNSAELEKAREEKLRDEKLKDEKQRDERLKNDKLVDEKLRNERLYNEKLKDDKFREEKLKDEKAKDESLRDERLKVERLNEENNRLSKMEIVAPAVARDNFSSSVGPVQVLDGAIVSITSLTLEPGEYDLSAAIWAQNSAAAGVYVTVNQTMNSFEGMEHGRNTISVAMPVRISVGGSIATHPVKVIDKRTFYLTVQPAGATTLIQGGLWARRVR